MCYDFEKVLNECYLQSTPNEFIFGWLFYSKKDLKRKLIDLFIYAFWIDVVMPTNNLDIVKKVPKGETYSKGMNHTKRVIESVGLFSEHEEELR